MSNFRLLDPRERARHKAHVRHQELQQAKTVALVKNQEFTQHEELVAAEQAIKDAHQHHRQITCAFCSASIDMAKDKYVSATICSIIKHDPLAPNDQQALIQYFQPPHDERVLQGHSGVIVLLEPPTTGTLGICLACCEKLEAHLREQEFE